MKLRYPTEWLSELWRYRELLYFLAWRDVKLRYKQAALGVAWAIIQPLFAMVVFTMFFGRLASIPSDGIPYPIFSYCALVPWMYFSNVLGQATNSLVGNANLITKVYFPRILLPTATAVAGLLDFVVSAAVLAILLIYYRIPPGWGLLLAPVFLLMMILLTVSVSLLFSALNVRYRDVKYVIPFLLQLWLFCTPIIYPSTLVPARFKMLLALNPCWGIIEGFRSCLFPHRTIPTDIVGASAAVTLLLFAISLIYFRRAEHAFADII